jgi:hypothetical protein
MPFLQHIVPLCGLIVDASSGAPIVPAPGTPLNGLRIRLTGETVRDESRIEMDLRISQAKDRAVTLTGSHSRRIRSRSGQHCTLHSLIEFTCTAAGDAGLFARHTPLPVHCKVPRPQHSVGEGKSIAENAAAAMAAMSAAVAEESEVGLFDLELKEAPADMPSVEELTRRLKTHLNSASGSAGASNLSDDPTPAPENSLGALAAGVLATPLGAYPSHLCRLFAALLLNSIAATDWVAADESPEAQWILHRAGTTPGSAAMYRSRFAFNLLHDIPTDGSDPEITPKLSVALLRMKLLAARMLFDGPRLAHALDSALAQAQNFDDIVEVRFASLCMFPAATTFSLLPLLSALSS